MELTRDSVVVATPHQVSAGLGEEVVVLHLEAGRYFGLEGVGARVWELLREPVTVGEIEEVLLEEYDVEPERCRRDLRRLLTDLGERGLVDVRGGPSPD